MRRRLARQRPVEPRIVEDLDMLAEGAESRSHIEADGGRVVVSASMYPEAPDRARPGARDRAVHEPAAGARADQCGHEAAEGELTDAGLAEIELEEARLLAGAAQRVD